MVLYAFDKGIDRSKRYELLDFNYDVLKKFQTADERKKFLDENGLDTTDSILGYGEDDGLANKRKEVKKRSIKEWEKMYGDIFKR